MVNQIITFLHLYFQRGGQDSGNQVCAGELGTVAQARMRVRLWGAEPKMPCAGYHQVMINEARSFRLDSIQERLVCVPVQ